MSGPSQLRPTVGVHAVADLLLGLIEGIVGPATPSEVDESIALDLVANILAILDLAVLLEDGEDTKVVNEDLLVYRVFVYNLLYLIHHIIALVVV